MQFENDPQLQKYYVIDLVGEGSFGKVRIALWRRARVVVARAAPSCPRAASCSAGCRRRSGRRRQRQRGRALRSARRHTSPCQLPRGARGRAWQQTGTDRRWSLARAGAQTANTTRKTDRNHAGALHSPLCIATTRPSQVYKGRRRCTGQITAMKFIVKQGKSEKDIRSLRQEIEILRRLRHENIVQMLDAFETRDHFVVVMGAAFLQRGPRSARARAAPRSVRVHVLGARRRLSSSLARLPRRSCCRCSRSQPAQNDNTLNSRTATPLLSSTQTHTLLCTHTDRVCAGRALRGAGRRPVAPRGRRAPHREAARARAALPALEPHHPPRHEAAERAHRRGRRGQALRLWCACLAGWPAGWLAGWLSGGLAGWLALWGLAGWGAAWLAGWRCSAHALSLDLPLPVSVFLCADWSWRRRSPRVARPPCFDVLPSLLPTPLNASTTRSQLNRLCARDVVLDDGADVDQGHAALHGARARAGAAVQPHGACGWLRMVVVAVVCSVRCICRGRSLCSPRSCQKKPPLLPLTLQQKPRHQRNNGRPMGNNRSTCGRSA